MVQAAAQEICECSPVDLALEGGILGPSDDMVLARGVNEMKARRWTKV